MRNVESWVESKVKRMASGRYMANPSYVALGSRFIVDTMVEPYQALLREHARGRLLDCGCGDVPFYAWYRDLVDESVCVDWGSSLHGRSHVDHEVDLNRALPLADASFDTVLLADVLEHIAEPQNLLAELSRILRPSGKLLITVPFFYQVHEAPHDYFRYTDSALKLLCRNAGFFDVSVSAYGGYPDVLCDLLNKGLANVPALCHPFLWWARFAASTTLYRKLRANTVHRFPLGYCVVAQKPVLLAA
jgi:SAM-dependent methyltransferase